MYSCCLSREYQYLFNINQHFFENWTNFKNVVAKTPKKLIETKSEESIENFDVNLPKQIVNKKNSLEEKRKKVYCQKAFGEIEDQVLDILKTKCGNESTVQWFYTTLQHMINQIFDYGEVDRSQEVNIPIILAKFLMDNYPIEEMKTMYDLSKKIKDKNRTVMNLCLLFATQSTNINKELRRSLREHLKKQSLLIPGCPYLWCVFNGKIFEKFILIHYSEYSTWMVNGQSFDKMNRKEIDRACQYN